MKTGTCRKIIIFLFLINPAFARADLDASSVRFEPLPVARRLAAGSEQVSPEDFRESALTFSGVADADLARYRAAFDAAVSAVKVSFAGRTVDRSLADDLLVFLHDRYLTRYQEEETRLDRLLDTGLYNCVSSSVLYLAAADALGIAAAGVRTKDHSFVKVSIGAASYDVETTNPYGFDPGKRKEFFDAFGAMTGFVYTPPGNYTDRRDIVRKEVLSLILFNRIAAFAGARNFGAAIGVASDLFELVKNEETMQTFLGVVSGVAASALETGRYEAGYDVLDRAVSAHREFDALQDLRRDFLRDWAGRLVEKKAFAEAESLLRREYARGKIPADDFRSVMLFRYQREAEAAAADPRRGLEEALAVIAAAKKDLGDDPALSGPEKAYAHNLVLALVEKGSFTGAQAAADRFRGEKTIDETDYRDLTVFRIQKQASSFPEKAGAREALRTVEEGITAIGRHPSLLKSAGVYAYNWCLWLIQSGKDADAAAFLAGDEAAYLAAQTRRELALYRYTARADAAENENDYPASVAALEEGLAALGPTPELLRHYEVLVHNRMIDFYKAKEYDQAEETLRRGLAVYPTSSMLANDLQTIMKLKNK